MLSLVSLWRSEGEEGQRYSRAEGKGTADDNEKHDTYKSITNAGVLPRLIFRALSEEAETERFTAFSSRFNRRTSRESPVELGPKYGLYRISPFLCYREEWLQISQLFRGYRGH